MKTSAACLDLIKGFEGFSAKPYRCPAGVPTIGYGVTKYPDGRSVSINDPAVTLDEAHELLVMVLDQYEAAVERLVQVPLSQGQFDALVSFTFNIGEGNLSNSTLLRILNAGDYAAAAKEFGRWVYCNGERLPGLVKRRTAEKMLFISEVKMGIRINSGIKRDHDSFDYVNSDLAEMNIWDQEIRPTNNAEAKILNEFVRSKSKLVASKKLR